MISNGEKHELSKTLAMGATSKGHETRCGVRPLSHYLAVKKLSALLRGITSKHYGEFFCLICLYSFRTKNKLESHKNVCKNKDFCNVIMPSEDNKILEFNRYQKSHKAPFIIYADLECIIEKTDGSKNNPENSSTTKVSEPIHQVFQCLQNLCLEA